MQNEWEKRMINEALVILRASIYIPNKNWNAPWTVKNKYYTLILTTYLSQNSSIIIPSIC